MKLYSVTMRFFVHAPNELDARKLIVTAAAPFCIGIEPMGIEEFKDHEIRNHSKQK